MKLHDGGVALRAIETDDLDRVSEYLAHEDLIGRRGIERDQPRPMSQAELMAAIEDFPRPKHGMVFGIWSEDHLVGHAGVDVWWDALTPFVDVVIDPAHQRRGIGTIAARLVIDGLFHDSVAKLVGAWIPDWNDAGLAFSRSLGFVQVGTARRTGLRDGRYVDSTVLSVARSAWEASWH